MKANRTITREKAMTVLYQIFLYNKNNISYKIDDVINEILESMDIEDRKKIDINFLNDLVNGVINNMDNIDKYISKYLSNWTIDRLGLTDQAIIRISVYELMYTSTPNLVCINEAIELAKRYSDEKVAKMINGVLDKIYHEIEDNCE
ncbi:MAG: transcription antitermination factor NusB [Bacilli bacterium]|nr:transcription antitermination factor NusB [Bacilli bacterium]